MSSEVKAPTYTADEALARLKAGNDRFLNGKADLPMVQKDVLAELAEEQRPYVTILGCSDSRVPPELVFDAGLGELFVIRVAGNVLGPSILGTLQYAAFHLRTPLFVVMGHEGCGAVKAALASRYDGAQEVRQIAHLLELILPALEELDQVAAPEELLSAGVESNVRWTVRQLITTMQDRAKFDECGMKLVGAIYDLKTGRVRFLDEGR